MPGMQQGLVISHNQVNRDMFELEFIAPEIAEECQPGQFIHIKPGLRDQPLLRRPLSIYDVDKRLGSVTLLYKVVGTGTRLLTSVRTKEYVDVMGPLGRGFKLPDQPERILLVGGGVGIAPLVYLARVLEEQGCDITVLHGTESRRQLVAFEKLRQIGTDFFPATMDGTAGYKGLVTELLLKKIEPKKLERIYTCGPEPMMAVVAEFAANHNIEAEVSLEEYMACGVGACLGCARKLKTNDTQYVKVCKDGPVFNIKEVELYK